MKKLAEKLTIQDSPVSRKGFLGRGALVSGLDDEPPSSRTRREQQTLSAAIVKEAVMSVVHAVRVKNAFEELAVFYASGIWGMRAGSRPPERASSETPTVSIKPKKPENDEKALEQALQKMGLKAKVTGRQTTPSGMFVALSVEIEGEVPGKGETCRVPLSTTIMEEEDPVAEAGKWARKFGIQTRETSRGMVLENRRRSRPPAPEVDSLGIDQCTLDRRKLSYDGVSEELKQNHFTYTGAEIDNTICAPLGLKGRELLEYLDSRILEMHMKYDKPFEASVLEEASWTYKAPPAIENLGQGGLKVVAKTLHRLICSAAVDEKHVPPEYLNAYRKLKNSREYYAWSNIIREGALSKDEIEEFRRAFDEVDHPAHRMVREMHKQFKDADGEITDEHRSILDATLHMHGDYISGLSEPALRQLHEAFMMVAHVEGMKDWTVEKMEQKHLQMMFTIKNMVESLNAALSS
jgi:hypothetical protein